MKVSAANQSLILANDGPSGGKPPASASQSSRSASSGGTSATGLQRLTVVAELPDSTVVTVHADYGGNAGTYSNPSNSADRVVSSQTPSATQDDDSDSDVHALLGSISSSGTGAVTESAASSADAVATTGTNTASTSASASSLVQLSSLAYNSLLRDSDNSRDTAGNPHSSNENVALYARTQRTTGAARSSSLVDVHA
jgi:hypothetical protein